VPTRALIEQWGGEIAARYPGDVGCYGDGRREVAAVTVATFESAYRHMDQLGNRFDLLIVDEAHHFGSGIRDEALEMSAASARLGLTATPPNGESARRLAELVGPRVFELAVGDLAGTFLASFDVVTIRVELDAAERMLYARFRERFLAVHREYVRMAPHGEWAQFVAFAMRTEIGRAALAAWRASQRLTTYPAAKRRAVATLLARHRASRVLVFTADNATAYAIAREHLVMPLTCDIDRRERQSALAAFQEGRLGALVSARVLNEGIDVPDADVAIVVGGTLGEREHVQRVGRLLRPRAGKRALVYELVCSGTTETRVAKRRQRALAPQGSAQL
jgi:superfamily II DNA or RNA helicase